MVVLFFLSRALIVCGGGGFFAYVTPAQMQKRPPLHILWNSFKKASK